MKKTMQKVPEKMSAPDRVLMAQQNLIIAMVDVAQNKVFAALADMKAEAERGDFERICVLITETTKNLNGVKDEARRFAQIVMAEKVKEAREVRVRKYDDEDEEDELISVDDD